MRVTSLALAFLLLSGLSAADEPAGDLGTALLEVPEIGPAVVLYPAEWQKATTGGDGKLPPTIRLRSGPGEKPVSLQITLIPDPTGKLGEEKALAGATLQASEHFKEGSVEGKTQLVRLPSRYHKGLFAQFTDARWKSQAPPPGEYRHATVGVVSLGDTAAAFTLLSNDLDGRNYQLGLLTVADGLHREPPAAPQR